MEEKRRSRRSDLNVVVQLRHCEEKQNEKITVEVFDLSRDGIGFLTAKQLLVGDYYDTDITIWTKEIIKGVIKIVRKRNLKNGKVEYGSEFVGLSENEKFRIDVYQCVEENQ